MNLICIKHYEEIKDIVEYYEVGEMKFLWDTWTIKQKLVWFWKNKLGFGMKEIEDFADYCFHLQNNIILNLIDEGEYEAWKEQNWKYWFEDNPKSVLITDIYLTPIAPTKHIEINTKVII